MAAATSLPLPLLRCLKSGVTHFRIHFPPTSSLLSVTSTNVLLKKKRSKEKFPYTTRTSSEGVPSELVEDSKFVPLNADDPVYGPPALLLMGFDAEETDKIQKFLREFDGEFLKVIHCTEDMLTKSIWDAMHAEQPDLKAVKIAKSVPRICFLSGLTGEEMMMFIDAYPEAGLKPAVFAALVPNSADKLLMEVAEEIMGDHEMMSAKQQPN
ncbi:uncharacterized protein M6B38_325215 [Iris pallida]|uniref:Uncharacterized protein n=1 Tax=Iris pallida TaxID=29817 RepID=A0AAX6H6V9_IRIPA|nr:uncharacterized protein M6B38_325215 [Iris pallida]